ncbi:WXG100 family type VII secretion target [Cellulomonas bogoriensis]|uniref:WXG100 family type VII secretion target n=1 Tax=Cellulomonas bogoriensis 69B4 = DSM 16987 TaxID=1386082 RepID=A0A0A0BYV4_9CELL|nr:WXG100 family type VII secretion target [Cellulomonas bogoriensis]KGM12329.1 hypothetical protein N869_16970 [Cellulomonas bogoriensis 69B4 = DSM 16987]
MALSATLSVWDKVNAWMSPLDGMVDALMRPLVDPLVGMFDSVTGRSSEVRSTAQRWRDLAATLDELVDHHQRVITPLAQSWDGAAHEAFQASMRELLRNVDELASSTRETAEFLEDAAMEVELAEELVATIIRELIQWALLTLAVSAALSIVTVGASALAGGAAAAAQAAVAGSRIATVIARIATALQRFATVLQTINKMRFFSREGFFIKTLLVKGVLMRPVVSNLTGLSAAPVRESVRTGLVGLRDIAADEFDDTLRGETGLQTPLRARLDGLVGPAAEGARPAAEALAPVTAVVEEVDRRLPRAPFQ